MYAECHQGLGQERIVIKNPSIVIIRNDAGEIVTVVSEHMSGGICCVRPTDSDFERVCTALGLKPPTVQVLNLPPPPKGAELIR